VKAIQTTERIFRPSSFLHNIFAFNHTFHSIPSIACQKERKKKKRKKTQDEGGILATTGRFIPSYSGFALTAATIKAPTIYNPENNFEVCIFV
jgi:hypothetical protein